MCMQNFITIFFTVLETGPFSLFKNLELGKASTDKKCHFAISVARSCQYQCLRKLYQNIPLSLRDRAILTFSKFSTRPMINVIFQFLGLDLFNIKLSAKFYQNIPNGLIVNFHFFSEIEPRQNLDQSKMPFDNLMATSCQHTNVYAKFHHNILLSSKDRAIFTFSEFGARQNLDRWQMTFHNLLG